MTFILTFTLPPETRDEAIARFLETGGQPPPAVTLLGRWTQLDLCGGFVLLESADPQAFRVRAWVERCARAHAGSSPGGSGPGGGAEACQCPADTEGRGIVNFTAPLCTASIWRGILVL